MKLSYIFFILIFVVGCASTEPNHGDPQPDPLTLPANAQGSIFSAQECKSPAVARQKLSSGFKYGCFCGKGHPEVSLPSGATEPSKEERAQLVALYLAIKPIDSIDAACQAHDICWTRFGRSELSCNERFIDKLNELGKTWNARISFFEVDSLNFRCQFLARDIQFATDSVMEGVTENDSLRLQTKIKQWVTFPITVAYAAITLFGGFVEGNYPRPEERCIAP